MQEGAANFQLWSKNLNHSSCLVLPEGCRRASFELRFSLRSSQPLTVASRSVDMIVDCESSPYLLRTAYVYVGSEANRQILDNLRHLADPLSEEWDADPSSVVPLGVSASEMQHFDIPDTEWLCHNLNSIDLQNKPLRLKVEEYKNRFHTLLYLEELECKKKRHRYSRKGLRLLKSKEAEELRVVGLDCSLPPVTGQDSMAYVRLSQEREVYEIPVHDVKDQGIVVLDVKRNRSFWTKINDLDNADPLIDFQLKHDRTHFCSLHRGIDRVSREVLRSHLCEISSAGSSPVKLSDLQSLYPKSPVWTNERQSRAVGYICSESSRRLVIINGPFGTGKTMLLKEAIVLLCLQATASARILVCTQSNHAADIYVKELDKCSKFSTKMIRVCYQWRKPVTVPAKIRKRYCILGKTKDGQDCFRDPDMNELRKHQKLVVVTTLTTARVLITETKGFFSHIIIDEAAQASEPESIIPLALACENTRVVLAGDHQQVPPTHAYTFFADLYFR